MAEQIPGWEGSIGPFPGQALGESKHVQAAPGVPIPDEQRP